MQTNIRRLTVCASIALAVCFGAWVVALGYFYLYDLNRFKLARNLYRPNPYALGNILSSYFYYVYAEDPKNHFTEIDYQDIFNTDNHELLAFYRSLNWQHQAIFPFTTAMNETWNQFNRDGAYKKNYLKYWQYIRPHMQDLFARNLEKVTVQTPVIHFRCSDVPFNKSNQYHLIKKDSVAWIAEKIKNVGYNQAVLLMCNSYLTWDHGNSCQQYADYYIQQFAEYGVTLQQQCNELYHDFAMMYYAPLLVSLNASSYSFMAGVAKDPSSYISANMGIEISGRYQLQSEADWVLCKYEPLLHANVVEYEDPETVIEQLR